MAAGVRQRRRPALDFDRRPGRLQQSARGAEVTAAREDRGQLEPVFPIELRCHAEQLVLRRAIANSGAAQPVYGKDPLAQAAGGGVVPQRDRSSRKRVSRQRRPQVAAQPRQDRIVHRDAGILGLEQHLAGIAREPGRGPVGGAPEPDAAVGALPATEGRDDLLELGSDPWTSQRIGAEGSGRTIEGDQRLGPTRELLGAPVGVHPKPALRAPHHGERRGAQAQSQRGPVGIEIVGEIELRRGGVAKHAGHGIGARVKDRAHRQRQLYRIGIGAAPRREAERGAVAGQPAEVESHFASATRLERGRSLPCT